MIFKVRHHHFSCFFMIFQILFRHRFLDRFFIAFGQILAPFSTLFRSFWHHFGILFRCRFFDDLLMVFWTTFGSKSISRAAIPDVTFFIHFLVFPGPRSVGRFWMDFHGCWTDFQKMLMDFSCIFMSFSQQFRINVTRISGSFQHVPQPEPLRKDELLERPF